MSAEVHPSTQFRERSEHEPRVTWLDVGCAWLAVVALGVLGLML